MLKIITVSNHNDDLMTRVRDRIKVWAKDNGWLYTFYNDPDDHVAGIQAKVDGRPIEVIDCVCHGTPTSFDGTLLHRAFAWGKKLSGLPGFSSHTSIYLDACNTALQYRQRGPITQYVANGAGCAVYGTRGYVDGDGTYAENNEICLASPPVMAPYYLTRYPGAQDAAGRNVWVEFRSQEHATEIKMKEQTSFEVSRSQEDAAELASAIEAIMQTPTIEFPSLRIAPDLTINYEHAKGVSVLDIYANGSLIKDRIQNKTWPVSDPERFQATLSQFLEGKM